MGSCNSQIVDYREKNELKKLNENDEKDDKEIKSNTITCEIISFKKKEDKLIEYGLLINNYLFDPITNKEYWYDKRTINYRDKINEFYNIILIEEKNKGPCLTYEKYIRNVFIIEYKKQNKSNNYFKC